MYVSNCLVLRAGRQRDAERIAAGEKTGESMASTITTRETSSQIRGTIIEAEVKTSVDPTRPLPLACALYAIEAPEGVWLCAYYGSNRSNFDFLPQKGAQVDDKTLGIAFHHQQFVPKDQFQPAVWEQFKKSWLMTYGGHGE